MSDLDLKSKRSFNRKKNMIAKVLRDPGDMKGAFALKVIDSRKQEYKRIKMKVTSYEQTEED